jgi:arylsulfatase A-like enzyme
MRFVNARSPGAWTLPSHASMFTGRWPHELSVGVEQPLDARFPTIAEHMAANGYSTAGFVANTFFCNAWFGLDRGFGRYEDTAVTPQTILRSSHLGRKLFRSIGNAPHERPSAHFNRKSAATINTEFLAWLDGRSSEPRPFFAFLNYFDAHDPYMLPHHELPSFAKAPRSAHDIRLLRDWNLLSAKKLTPTQIAMARDCYDDCLRQLDLELGRLVDQLDRRGVLQTTWLIVTSDHGEQFGEHGQIGHGNAVQRETVHVPLLIIPPKQSDRTAQVITQPVSLRNVPATVVAVAGLSESASPFPGSALVPTTEAVADELVMSELTDPEGPQPPGWRPARSVVADGFVYIQQSDGREQLFDLASDPDEKHDLATLPAHATTLEQFRARVRGR